jgi:ABC-type amino acid transport substrate-binding protein
MLAKRCFRLLIPVVFIAAMAPRGAIADKLDDIQKAQKLRCGVLLDLPPVGYRDANNNPVGYDIEICQDMAKALGVEPEIVETPSPDRIPALLSDRVDVSVSSATNSLERAKVVAFSIPYQIWSYAVVVRKDSDVKKFDDLKGKRVGIVRGTTPETYFLPIFKQWNDPNGSYTPYGSDADRFLALSQGKIDASVEGNVALGQFLKTPQGKDFVICCNTPFPEDWTGIMVRRNEQGLLNWVNLFLWHEIKNGRVQELYRKWWGIDAPSLALPNASW